MRTRIKTAHCARSVHRGQSSARESTTFHSDLTIRTRAAGIGWLSRHTVHDQVKHLLISVRINTLGRAAGLKALRSIHARAFDLRRFRFVAVNTAQRTSTRALLRLGRHNLDAGFGTSANRSFNLRILPSALSTTPPIGSARWRCLHRIRSSFWKIDYKFRSQPAASGFGFAPPIDRDFLARSIRKVR